jgi:hypothetical protein
LFDRVKLIATSGEDLMRVCLMADIPNQTVTRRVEDVMHRDGELNGTERSTRVPADARTCVDNELADLVSNLLQVVDAQLPKVCRRIDLR